MKINNNKNMELIPVVVDSELKAEIQANPKSLELVGDTGINYLRFSRSKALYREGTKDEDSITNPLSLSDQIELISDIFKNCKVVKTEEGSRIAIYFGGSNVLLAEKNFQNFKTIILEKFKKITYVGKTDKQIYFCINLIKIFQILKATESHSLTKSVSVFHKSDYLDFDSSTTPPKMTIYKKLNYASKVNLVPKAIYDEIVKGMNDHWQGNIPIILDHMVAGKYTNDKKNLWFAIFADTNFGKSKLFEFMMKQQYIAYVKFEDLATKGITNVSPEAIEGKLALVVDEVVSFNRSLYDISSYISMRPMGRHSVNVDVHSRFLLSADGGIFNNSHMEEQIVTRVAVMDLRSKSVKMQDLAITLKFGKATIELVMVDYLYQELRMRFEEYEKLNDIEKINKADKIITEIVSNHKIVKPNLFQIINEHLQIIMMDISGALDERVSNELKGALVFRENGWIIKRPSTLLNKILLNYDESLKYELQFKSPSQIADKLDGYKLGKFKVDGKTISGFFVPKKVEPIIEHKGKDDYMDYEDEKYNNEIAKREKELFNQAPKALS